MHVLCAPPAFILSQDQTLLLSQLLKFVRIFLELTYAKFRRNFTFFINSTRAVIYKLRFHLASFPFSFLFGSTKNYRYWSFKGFIVYFSMCFLFSFSKGTYCIILHHFLLVNTFFKNILIFFLFPLLLKIEQKKKLVVALLLTCFRLLISYLKICHFQVICFCIIYDTILNSLCQYFFMVIFRNLLP